MRKKKTACLLGCLLCLASVTACAKAENDNSMTSLVIDKNGTVTHTIVEAFQSEYYSAEALSAMIEEEIASYGQDISLLNVEEDEGNICVTMQFASDSVYTGYSADYNEDALYYDTIQNYFYSADMPVPKAKDISVIAFCSVKEPQKKEVLQNISELSANHLMILEWTEDAPVRIVFPANVLYVSEGVQPAEAKTVTIPGSGIFYVITK